MGRRQCCLSSSALRAGCRQGAQPSAHPPAHLFVGHPELAVAPPQGYTGGCSDSFPLRSRAAPPESRLGRQTCG